MNPRPPLTRDTTKAYRRAFLFGIFPGRSPLMPPVADARMERLVCIEDYPQDVRVYRYRTEVTR